ncbi:hypothetical protein DFH06DRAFT_1133587 [Mycena polygramma]|nr:hypothetical protein DFH06DRAFT_1133587 [Mycena polygramma]
MARATKSSSKPPSKGKSTRATRRKNPSQTYVDDEAAESDDGVMVEAEDKGDDEYDMVANESDVAFIDDRSSRGEIDDIESKLRTKKRSLSPMKRTSTRQSDDVIDVAGSSSEEDLTAMDADDRKPQGLKSSALPEPIGTRSSTSRREVKDGPPPFVIKKKAKPVKKMSDAELHVDDKTMEQFKLWMAAQSKKTSDPVDGSETVSENSEDKRHNGLSARSAPKQARRDMSPDWDPPLQLSPSKGNKRTVQMRQRLECHVPRRTTSEADISSAGGSEEDAGPDMKRPSKSSIAKRLDFAESRENRKDQTTHEKSRAKRSSNDGESDVEEPSTVFLEDIETYKVYFDPRAPCGVADPDLQDPVLEDSYSGLPPLPKLDRANRQILPAFDPQGLSYDESADVKGGRVKFSSWKRHLKHMLPDNSYGAITFTEAEPNFINPSRVSPLRLSRQASPGSSPTYRLLVGSHIAVCVSAVFCSESVLVEAAKIGPKSERLRKWVSGIFHNQEWERFEALTCLVFGETIMYGQISAKKAVAFQTMISPDSQHGTKGDADQRFDAEAPADMFSPVMKKTPAKKTGAQMPKFKSKTLLAYNDVGEMISGTSFKRHRNNTFAVPVYDARKVVVDFQSDLDHLDQVLPRFSGEVPFGSFVVVGYTLSGYQGLRSGSTDKVAHLGCNVVQVHTLEGKSCPIVSYTYSNSVLGGRSLSTDRGRPVPDRMEAELETPLEI